MLALAKQALCCVSQTFREQKQEVKKGGIRCSEATEPVVLNPGSKGTSDSKVSFSRMNRHHSALIPPKRSHH